MFTNQCRNCDRWTNNRAYCQPCINEDTAQTDNWERSYVERCEAAEEYVEVAHERKAKRDEQRHLENDANWV